MATQRNLPGPITASDPITHEIEVTVVNDDSPANLEELLDIHHVARTVIAVNRRNDAIGRFAIQIRHAATRVQQLIRRRQIQPI
jgi:hypothetical protein